MRVCIIGGGLSGLALAYFLQKAGVAYDLYEASERPGGNLLSWRTPEGYELEGGPNSLLLSAELEALLAELGLAEAVQEAAPVSQHRYVLRGGQLRALPASPPALLASSFFGLGTKARLLAGLLRRPAPPRPGETLGDFGRRHFGREAVDYALRPFVAGTYAGNPDELLVQLTFPQLAALEAQYGSVLRGLARGPKTARRRTVQLRGGVQALTDALAARLTGLHLGQPVTGIQQAGPKQFFVGTESAAPTGPYTHLALAVPAYTAATLLRPLHPAAAEALAAVCYPPMALVYTAYDRAAVAHPLAGFGALHPPAEGSYSAGAIWTGSLFPERVPAGQVLFTSFVGGAAFVRPAQEPEVAQLAAVDAELRSLYGITAAPRWQGRTFWPRSIPQFDAYLAAARAALAPLAAEGIIGVANWAGGVSVPDCVKHAQAVANRLAG